MHCTQSSENKRHVVAERSANIGSSISEKGRPGSEQHGEIWPAITRLGTFICALLSCDLRDGPPSLSVRLRLARDARPRFAPTRRRPWPDRREHPVTEVAGVRPSV